VTGSLKDTYELAVLDRLLGNQTLTPPATWYVALYTVAPADGTAGTEVSTAVWTNYARVAVTNNLTNFPSANPKVNGTPISWAAATIVGAAPTVVGAALCDASTAGNQWIWFSFTGVAVTNTSVFSFANGDLSLGCD
jgi:hypothetical protein